MSKRWYSCFSEVLKYFSNFTVNDILPLFHRNVFCVFLKEDTVYSGLRLGRNTFQIVKIFWLLEGIYSLVRKCIQINVWINQNKRKPVLSFTAIYL